MSFQINTPGPRPQGDPHIAPPREPLPIPVFGPAPPDDASPSGLAPRLVPQPPPQLHDLDGPHFIAGTPQQPGTALPNLSFLDP